MCDRSDEHIPKKLALRSDSDATVAGASGHRGHVLLTPRQSELHDECPQCHVKRARARRGQRRQTRCKSAQLTETTRTRSLCQNSALSAFPHAGRPRNGQAAALTAGQQRVSMGIQALQRAKLHRQPRRICEKNMALL
ncbi:hypothetical protein L1887_51837 [Cichorium endivia]|nr:hypothetical protein L1887_51837 [Cichorium endivia]